MSDVASVQGVHVETELKQLLHVKEQIVTGQSSQPVCKASYPICICLVFQSG